MKAFDLSVISPNGNECWDMGSSQYITWSIVGSISSVNIDCSTDGGGNWIPVAAGAANNGAYRWTVPATPSLNCLVRVSDAANPGVYDVSDAVFFISASSMESITTPTEPLGPDAGTKNSLLTYSASGSASSLGHEIQYKFDWGDGSDSGWLAAGMNTAAHEWAAAGTYPVRARARCAVHTGVESSWSEATAVTIHETLAQTLLWNTFLGNSDVNEAIAVAVDAGGNIYVTGKSSLSWGSPINPYAGGEDAFLAKLNAAGELQWLTFMGGSNNDVGNGVAIDNGGNILVTGSSFSTWGTPIRKFTTPAGSPDGFAAKFSASGARLWSTFLGGSSWDYGLGVAVDVSGNVFVAGLGYSRWGSPINAHSGTSTHDGFLVRLNASGALQWLTFFGGSGSSDRVTAITLDGDGNAVVSGNSTAAWGSPLRSFSGGEWDAYAAKFNSSGARLWHTFLGGDNVDWATDIALDGSGSIFLTGHSASSWGMPLNPLSGSSDGFLSKLKANGVLQWNTFMGGSGADAVNGIVLDGDGCAVVVGTSDAPWGSPVNPFAGGKDGFMVKFASSGDRQWTSFLGGGGEDHGNGISLDDDGHVVLVGKSDSTWGNPLIPFSGSFDAYAVKLAFGLSGLSVISPNGGENWLAGSSHDIRWSLVGSLTGIDIDYSTDDGATWNPVARNTANDGSYSWTVPDDPSTTCRVRVSDVDGDPVDASDGAFSILAAGTEIVSAPDAPAGPASGFLSASYEFTAGGSVSNLGHDIQYKFDWGDGTDSGWLATGTTTAAHTWTEAGIFSIQAIARCTEHTGVESAWSAPSSITIEETSTPSMLWNTFLGNAAIDEGNAIAVDNGGNIYVTGKRSATWGSPINAFAGGEDAFLAKLNADGELQWLTFMGGGNNDVGNGIAMDGGGNILVTGSSFATWESPIRTFKGSAGTPEGFVAKFDPNGARLWNTFLGGTNWDYAIGVATDSGNNVFVTGMGYSSWGSPINAHSGTNTHDAYLVKLNASGALQWLTFFGGKNGSDRATCVRLDGSGNPLVAGFSYAAWGSPVNPFSVGETDAYVAKFNAGGARQWHTFLGGSGIDVARAMSLDDGGNVFATGYSASTWGSPVNPFSGGNDGFLAKLNASGALQWNTFMGGSGSDSCGGIVLDGDGGIKVAGSSDATWGSPVSGHSGGNDIFVAQCGASGGLQWNTFTGGSGADYGSGIAMDGAGSLLVVGKSDATWGSPVNPHSGGDEVVAVKIGF